MKVIWEEVVKEKEKAVAKLGRSIEEVIKTTTSFGKNPSAQVPGGKTVSHSREEVEAFLVIFDGVADEMAESWKEGETNLAVKRRMLDHLDAIIQRF